MALIIGRVERRINAGGKRDRLDVCFHAEAGHAGKDGAPIGRLTERPIDRRRISSFILSAAANAASTNVAVVLPPSPSLLGMKVPTSASISEGSRAKAPRRYWRARYGRHCRCPASKHWRPVCRPHREFDLAARLPEVGPLAAATPTPRR
jgi:hypothetical protein